MRDDSLLGSRMTFYLNVPRIDHVAYINKGSPHRASCTDPVRVGLRVYEIASWGNPSGAPRAPEGPGLRRGRWASWQRDAPGLES